MYSLIPAHRPRLSDVRKSPASEARYYRAFGPRPQRLTAVVPFAAIVGVVALLVEFVSR